MDNYRRFECMPLLNLLGNLGLIKAQHAYLNLMQEQDYLQQLEDDHQKQIWHDMMHDRYR